MKYEIDTTYKPNAASPLGQAFGAASTRFLRLQSRINAADRAFHRNLDQLRLLEAERLFFESESESASDPEAGPAPDAPPTPDLPTE